MEAFRALHWLLASRGCTPYLRLTNPTLDLRGAVAGRVGAAEAATRVMGAAAVIFLLVVVALVLPVVVSLSVIFLLLVLVVAILVLALVGNGVKIGVEVRVEFGVEELFKSRGLAGKLFSAMTACAKKLEGNTSTYEQLCPQKSNQYAFEVSSDEKGT